MRYIIETKTTEYKCGGEIRIMYSHIVRDMMRINSSGAGVPIANFFDLEKGVEYTEFLNSKVMT